MTSENQNFEMYEGEDKTLTITVVDVAGAAVNLTDATIKWQVKRNVDDTSPLIEKTTAGGITITDAEGGVFTIALADTDTANLGGEGYHHEAEVTDVSGNISTVTRGVMTIKKALI